MSLWDRLFKTKSNNEGTHFASSALFDLRQGADALMSLRGLCDAIGADHDVPTVVRDDVDKLERQFFQLARSRRRWFDRWARLYVVEERLRIELEASERLREQQARQLAQVRTPREDVWVWDGDPEGLMGLTAPVVMPMHVLQDLLEQVNTAKRRRDELVDQLRTLADARNH